MGIEFIDFGNKLINTQHISIMMEYQSDADIGDGRQMYYIRTVDDAVYRCQKSVVSENFKRFYNSKSNRINLEERIDKLEKDLLEKYQELENHIKFLPIVSQEYQTAKDHFNNKTT